MAKELKQLIYEQFESSFRGLDACVLVDYQGLVSEETYDLRKTLNANNLRMIVVHNRIAKKAFADLGIDDVAGLAAGPTAVVYGGDDPVSVSRTLMDWRKKYKKLAIKGGVLDGRPIDGAQVEKLAELPTRPELLSQVLGAVIAPIQSVANLLNNTLTWVPNLVQSHIEKKEGSAA